VPVAVYGFPRTGHDSRWAAARRRRFLLGPAQGVWISHWAGGRPRAKSLRPGRGCSARCC